MGFLEVPLCNAELMEAYEGRQRWLHDQATIRDEAIEKGKEVGIEKGKEVGIEKGKEVGIEEGIIQTAKKLKAAGADMELICGSTGLSKEEIEKL